MDGQCSSPATSNGAAAIESRSEEKKHVDVKLGRDDTIGEYKVVKRIGAGGCGVVYSVMSKGGTYYAMKVERTDIDKSDQLLPMEAHVLKRLQFSPHATAFIQFGTCRTASNTRLRVLVMGLLGPSISRLQEKQHKYRFQIGTVLQIGIQALRAVIYLHCAYFVHRDIKPGNFAIDQHDCRRIYLIDFGLSRSLRKRNDCSLLRKPRRDVPFRGTTSYCSLNVHNRKEHGRHDDLWSIFYMLTDLTTGTLPWLGRSRKTTSRLKTKLMDFEYMNGCPVAFSTILNYLRSLNYYQRPDYVRIECAFDEMMKARRVGEKQSLDWEN